MRRSRRGCSTYLWILFIAFVAAYFIASFSEEPAVSLPDYDNTYPDYTYPGDDYSQDSDYDGLYYPTVNENGLGFTYYDQLNSIEKNIYNVFLEGIKNEDSTFKFDDVDNDVFNDYCFQAICALTYDHPEYFWVACGYSYRSSNPLFGGKGSASITLSNYSFWDYNLSKDQKISELEAAVDHVANLASQKATHFEKIQFVHDYLIENAIYDHDALDEYYKTYHDASCEYIFTAYGCLVNRKTVCAGYAKAFQLIMEKMGYDCLYVTGYAGESHAWNLVFIEGEGYYVDITWDDADFDKGEAPLYDYFGITTTSLQRTHTIGTEFSIPRCDADLYDYYNYTGRHLETYDFESAKSIIESQKFNDTIYIRFGSAYELERAKQDLLTDQNIYSMEPFSSGGSFSFVVNNNHYSLTFLGN